MNKPTDQETVTALSRRTGKTDRVGSAILKEAFSPYTYRCSDCGKELLDIPKNWDKFGKHKGCKPPKPSPPEIIDAVEVFVEPDKSARWK